MTNRERYLACFRFQPVDRAPFWDFGYWAETPEVWRSQGLPETVTDLETFFGFDPTHGVPVNTGLIPAFQWEILEEDEGSRVIRDSAGVVQRESTRGSSIPHFLEYPVKTREDWESFKERLQADDAGRYPQDWGDVVTRLRRRDYPVTIGAGGFFGNLRNILGFELLMHTYYDDPAWIHEMNEFFLTFWQRVMERALREVEVDAATMWEDMAYRNGPLISPAMFREFMLPYYKRMTGFLRDHGVDIVIVDSDGDMTLLLELFVEGGVTAMLPFEARAGMNILKVRREFGERMAIIGGIDKHELAKDRAAIDRELLTKLPPLLATGGFVPTVDHRVPPTVPYENYRYYVTRKYEMLHDHRLYR
jgi:uroporphyrinogen decarboxylase